MQAPSVELGCLSVGLAGWSVELAQDRGRASRLVSRILYRELAPVAAIHLGLPLPAGSCGLPADIGRAALNRLRRSP